MKIDRKLHKLIKGFIEEQSSWNELHDEWGVTHREVAYNVFKEFKEYVKNIPEKNHK